MLRVITFNLQKITFFLPIFIYIDSIVTDEEQFFTGTYCNAF